MIIAFRVGGIGLRVHGVADETCRSSALRSIFGVKGHWPAFRVKGPWRGGIEWAFHRLTRDELERTPLSPGDVPALSRCLSWGLSSPLLGAPRVRKVLAAAVGPAGFLGSRSRTQAGLIAVECRPNAVTVLDYGKSRGDVFFAEGGGRGKHEYRAEKTNRCTASNEPKGGLWGTQGIVSMKERVLGTGLLTPFLPAHGAFLVHAAAVVAGASVKATKAGTAIRTKAGSGARGGRGENRAKAALFLAPDEGGKTTAARLAAANINSAEPGSSSRTGPDDTNRALIIGDDQVILRRERARFWVHGTPWNLICAGPVGAPLGGIFLLEKGRHFRLVPLKAYDATAFIWDEHRHVTDFMPAAVRKKAFDLVAGACASVPVYRLTFTKDRLDWPAVLACLK